MVDSLPARAGRGPHTLGRYTLLGRLAAGGMGEIFLAELEGAAAFRKLCVVKRLLPHLADNPHFAELFFNEARIAARFSHPNVCHVYELGEEGGEYYIAMEYLEGASLQELRAQDKKRLLSDPSAALSVAQQACEGLHHVHELTSRQGEPLGIVHRDVSPSNLFLTADGVVKVLDFGIAKLRSALAVQESSSLKGKFGYMSPEQIRGEPLDRRADVFALGIVVHESLTGRRLFKRAKDVLLAKKILDEPIPSLSEERPDLPSELCAAVARALNKAPEERFPTARSFGQALVAAVGGTVLSPPDLASRLRPLLDRRITSRREALLDRTVTALAPSPLTPGCPPDSLSESGPCAATTIEAERNDGSTDGAPVNSGPRRSQRRRRPWLAALAILIIGSLAGALYATGRFALDQETVAIPQSGVDRTESRVGGQGTPPVRASPPAGSRHLEFKKRDRSAEASGSDAEPEAEAIEDKRPSEAGRDRPRQQRPRRRAKAVDRRPSDRPDPGLLFIDSEPYATIYSDGERIGDTPILRRAVPPGTYMIRAVRPDGSSRTRRIRVSPGQTVRHRFRF